jgi:3-oxoacyl-[acyl-carrier-protein] synthase-1
MVSYRRACVSGIGARTSIGLSAQETSTSVRAGIVLFAAHPFMVDKAGDRMVVARAPYLSEAIAGTERLAELAAPATQEALAPLAGSANSAPAIPIKVGLPGPRPGHPIERVQDFVSRFSGALAESQRVGPLTVFTTGHSAGLMALDAGCQSIETGEAELCLVGGVDSYLEPETLEWLDAEEQLHSRTNRWGFIPGEAAGFCLLASPSAAERYGLGVQGHVLAAATAMEPNRIKTDTVCIGEGLTESFGEALQPLAGSGTRVDRVICDLNGERYRADEYGFAIVRLGQYFVDPSDFLAPADVWGDVGAASGPLFVALATVGGRGGRAAARHVLAWASSESGERSAALLRMSTEG